MPKANSRSQLEYKLLFAIIVAGKTAKFAQDAMGRLRQVLLTTVGGNAQRSYFEAIRKASVIGRVGDIVRKARLGNYTKTAIAFEQLISADLDLITCTVDELEAIHGIGMKTSRFFLRWSGRRERMAVLDVHILRWLATECGHGGMPRTTPQSKKLYLHIQDIFLAEADKRGIHPADLDEELWLKFNKSGIRE